METGGKTAAEVDTFISAFTLICLCFRITERVAIIFDVIRRIIKKEAAASCIFAAILGSFADVSRARGVITLTIRSAALTFTPAVSGFRADLDAFSAFDTKTALSGAGHTTIGFGIAAFLTTAPLTFAVTLPNSRTAVFASAIADFKVSW
jgi:hypothetical protein